MSAAPLMGLIGLAVGAALVAFAWGEHGRDQERKAAWRAGLSFQARVRPWMLECFGAAVAADRTERCDRFIEEAFELVQSLGYDPARIEALRNYTWARPIGEPSQEVGGVMVTLAALCLAGGLDMHAAGEEELARINQPAVLLKIRAKQAAKARDIPFSPCPQQEQ